MRLDERNHKNGEMYMMEVFSDFLVILSILVNIYIITMLCALNICSPRPV